MNRSHWVGVIAGAMTAVVLAGCGGGSSSSTSATSSSSALTASAPGITPTTITIGSHQPLTGVAAFPYSEISQASNAYFKYVNAHGGVYGRKIVYKYIDDAYNPTTTSTVVHQLVLNDNVYAIFNGLGTAPHLAVVQFLNSQKIPDLFVASGCECWNNPATYSSTFGWQIDYVREGKILGNYIEQHFKGMKIGYFYQNDEFGQDGVKGLDYVIPAKQVVARQTYDPTNVKIGPAVAALKAAGAQVVVSFSIPAFTALLKLNELALNYNPTLVVSNVGSDPITLAVLLNSFGKQSGAFGTKLTNGIISDGYLPSPASTSNSWITLFKSIHDTYLPSSMPFDGQVLYGEAVGYTFVQAMFKAGRNPTRQDLINAIDGGLAQEVAVAPFAYSATDHNGITGAYMGVIQNGALVQQGDVLVTDDTATGPVTADTTPQPNAPTSGIPSP